MFIKKILLITIILLSLMLVTNNNLILAENNVKVGIQTSYPGSGLSGILDLNETTSVQGIFNVKKLSIRLLYRFNIEEHWILYGYGTVGAYNFRGKTVPGMGSGAGLEYSLRALNPTLPPLYYNIEAGINFYNDFSINYGSGLHFRF